MRENTLNTANMFLGRIRSLITVQYAVLLMQQTLLPVVEQLRKQIRTERPTELTIEIKSEVDRHGCSLYWPRALARVSSFPRCAIKSGQPRRLPPGFFAFKRENV